MKLDDIRSQIDEVDKHIVDLLEKRMSLALKAKAAKEKMGKKLLDPHRDEQVIINATANGKIRGLEDRFIKAIFSEILNESHRLQEL